MVSISLESATTTSGMLWPTLVIGITLGGGGVAFEPYAGKDDQPPFNPDDFVFRGRTTG